MLPLLIHKRPQSVQLGSEVLVLRRKVKSWVRSIIAPLQLSDQITYSSAYPLNYGKHSHNNNNRGGGGGLGVEVYNGKERTEKMHINFDFFKVIIFISRKFNQKTV